MLIVLFAEEIESKSLVGFGETVNLLATNSLVESTEVSSIVSKNNIVSVSPASELLWKPK